MVAKARNAIARIDGGDVPVVGRRDLTGQATRRSGGSSPPTTA
jgi:hypothetical protein